MIKKDVLLHTRLKEGEIAIIDVGSELGPPPDWGLIRWNNIITLSQIRLGASAHYIIENYYPYHSEFVPKKLVRYIYPIRAILDIPVNVA